MVLLLDDQSTTNGKTGHLYVALINITTVSNIWSKKVHTDSGTRRGSAMDESNVYVIFDLSDGQLVIICRMFIEDGNA